MKILHISQLQDALSKFGNIRILKEGPVFNLLMTGTGLDKSSAVTKIQELVLQYAQKKYPIIESMVNDDTLFSVVLKPKTAPVLTGIEMITAERMDQVLKHGYTLEHDIIKNDNGQLEEGAAYLLSVDFGYPGPSDDDTPAGWDKDYYRKLLSKPRMERLAIAGAWVAAQIDILNAEK